MEAIVDGRCFTGYAAHELRGSIAFARTLAEVALADPAADAATLREMGEQLVAACTRQERLLESLLDLARVGGPRRRETVDLASTAAESLRGQDLRGLACTARLGAARTAGDPQLVESLAANLVANAVGHNRPGGRVELATATAEGRAVLTVSNTGPVVQAADLPRLFQPFERLGSRADGAGLGLAVVQAIADAHRATVTARARPGGGLRIAVSFPALD